MSALLYFLFGVTVLAGVAIVLNQVSDFIWRGFTAVSRLFNRWYHKI